MPHKKLSKSDFTKLCAKLADAEHMRDSYRKRLGDEFFRGVIACLELIDGAPPRAVVPFLYRRIVESIGQSNIARVATIDGTQKWCGLVANGFIKETTVENSIPLILDLGTLRERSPAHGERGHARPKSRKPAAGPRKSRTVPRPHRSR